MRRLTAIALTAGLLLDAGSVAMAQTQSPSPAPSGSPLLPGRHFVLSEGGHAVTFPEGWEVLVLPVELDPIPVVRAEEGSDGVCSDGVAFCEVKVSPPCERPCATIIDEQAGREVAWFQSGSDVAVPSTIESVELDLPAGDAVRVRTEYTDPALTSWDRAVYHLTDGRVIATLLCIATDDPEDHWRSVAPLSPEK